MDGSTDPLSQNGDELEVDVRFGHPKDSLSSPGSLLSSLNAPFHHCDLPSGNDCLIYFDGQHTLAEHQLVSLMDGRYYLRVWDGRWIAAQILPDDGSVPPAVGGDLMVDVQGVLAELQGGHEMCIEGPFWLDQRSPGGQLCTMDFGSGRLFFQDLYSGLYDLSLRYLGEGPSPGFVLANNPAEVHLDTEALIQVLSE